MAEPTNEERQLEAMRDRARAELEQLDTTEALEDWRTRYLGRERGELTAVLKGLGKLPGEQRKIVGQAANRVKVDLEALLEARRGRAPWSGRRSRGRRCTRRRRPARFRRRR